MKDKLSRLSKFAQHQEIKALLKKQDKNETESLDFSDDISNDGNDDDPDFLLTPGKTKTKITPFTNYEGNKKRPKPFSGPSVPPKKSKKEKKNTEEEEQVHENSSNSDSDGANLLFTVRRDWKGTDNYYPSNKILRTLSILG